MAYARKTPSISDDVSRYTDINGLQTYLCVGRNKAMKIGIESGAKKKLGKRVIYDLRKIDIYLEELDSDKSDPERIESIIAATKESRSEFNRNRDSIT